ncbi:MAG: S-adenosylmethionine:tRNA ribosyltransferase-isomerase [Candidatus Aminicenantes bacterium]|nr:S-adenosylmethionine:tRNA ribosyltransferase-isomerase [Candidatus Aminicenantes bacterium]
MIVSDFDYDLPAELIAQRPLDRRDDSRMMVVSREDGRILHRRFKDFPDHLNKSDVLVLNDTKVIPAKAWGKRGDRSVEFLFIREKAAGLWDVLCKPAKRVRPGDKIIFPDELEAEVVETGEEGRRTLEFPIVDVLGHLKTIGFAPLPPYIKRKKEDVKDRPNDLDRYQTVFAAKDGAIAAPTAGLHFTPEILSEIRRKEVHIAEVTLDVGLATFQPMRAERLEDHKMLEESYAVSDAAAAEINRAKTERRPVVAVGTTVVRTLESAVRTDSEEAATAMKISAFPPFLKGGEGGLAKGLLPETFQIRSGPGRTSLFIYPGFEFKVVDRLLTNFHLPRSTLLMLVAAFAGRDLILRAYREAVREKYRFFSYGDCMLIL